MSGFLGVVILIFFVIFFVFELTTLIRDIKKRRQLKSQNQNDDKLKIANEDKKSSKKGE